MQIEKELNADPLDADSDVYTPLTDPDGRMWQRVLSFRELSAVCAEDIAVWDTIGFQNRMANQVNHDPNYRPLQPGDGTRKRRARR